MEALPGGFWSAAYGYRVEGQDLVLRMGTIPQGVDADRGAMAFDAPDLPVPKILAIGEAFNVGYAISERHLGRILEDVRPEEPAVRTDAQPAASCAADDRCTPRPLRAR